MGHRRVLRAGFAFMMTVLLTIGLLAPAGTLPVVAQGSSPGIVDKADPDAWAPQGTAEQQPSVLTQGSGKNEPAGAGDAGTGGADAGQIGMGAPDAASLPGMEPSVGAGQAITVTVIPAPLACGASGDLQWTTTSAVFGIVRQCRLNIPQDGYVFMASTASLAYSDGAYEAQFRVGIDNTLGDENVDRWLDIFADTGNGSDASMALSVLKPVTAGVHSFYLLGRRYAGPGTLLAHDPTLSVVYLPATSVTALACGASGNANWTTTAHYTTPDIARQCTLTVPGAGWVFMSADASMAHTNGDYEARFTLGIDSAAPVVPFRYVNMYASPDVGGSGTETNLALSATRAVTAGVHNFYLLGGRYSGTGTVLAFDPTLTVLYVPATSATTAVCATAGNTIWTTTADTLQIVSECTITMPRAGLVYIGADVWMYPMSGPVEAHFQIGVDSTIGDASTDRWVDIYDDAGDGTDKSMGLSVLKGLQAGTHTVYLLGRRNAGAGTVRAAYPTLSVIYVGAEYPKVFLPLVVRD